MAEKGPDGLEATHCERDLFDPMFESIAGWWRQFKADFLDNSDLPSGATDVSRRPVDPTSRDACQMQADAMRARVHDSVGLSDQHLVPWWARGAIDTDKNRIS